MSLQLPDFRRISFEEANPFLTGISAAQNIFGKGVENAYLPEEKYQALQDQIFKNLMASEKAKKAPEFTAAELAKAQAEAPEMKARTGLYGAQEQETRAGIPFIPRSKEAEILYKNAQAQEQILKNPFIPQEMKAEIALKKAQKDYYEMGGAAGGVGGKEEMFFQSAVAKDNPQLTTPEQIREASNALREGKNTLSDGTPLNPMSPQTRLSFDRLVKGTTDAKTRTGLMQGAQADAEIKVLSKRATEGLRPYGTTYLNKSPQQIADSFKSDPESQKRLGKFIAAKQLQYEIAQNEIKLAQGMPGVTSTMELMQLGQQNINADYPRLSQQAREEAQKYFIESLQEGFKARQAIPINASSLANPLQGQNLNPSKKPQTAEDMKNLSTEELHKILGE